MKKVWDNFLYIILFSMLPILGGTNSLIHSLVIGFGVFFILFFSNLIVYFFRRFINIDNKYLIFFCLSAMLVSVFVVLLQMFLIDIYDELKIYIVLLVVVPLFLDSSKDCLNSDLGFLEIMRKTFRNSTVFIVFVLIFGAIREFFGKGEIAGYLILPDDFPRLLILQTPAGAYLLLGFSILFINFLNRER